MDIKDLIHLLTAYPLIYRRNNIPELPKELEEVLEKISSLDYRYLEYCIHAYTPKNRDYEKLRDFLAFNIKRSRKLLKDTVNMLLKDVELDPKLITKIYDLGAGHYEWAKILKEVFPNADITLVEKSTLIYNPNFTFIQRDVDDWLDTFSDCNSSTLLFMSEFLHCKKDNIKLLESPNINKCHLIINELHPNETYIDYRLKQTGGGTIDPCDITKYVKSFIYYKNFFDYYIAYRGPVK